MKLHEDHGIDAHADSLCTATTKKTTARTNLVIRRLDQLGLCQKLMKKT